MTNTTKQTKNYEDMNNGEKAQVIYSKLLQDEFTTTLSDLLMELSEEYSDDEALYTVDDWLEYAEDANVCEIIKIAQKSSELNIDDQYIRESIYYYGYKTSNNVLDLVDKDEAVEWITNALEDNSSYVEDLNSELCNN